MGEKIRIPKTIKRPSRVARAAKTRSGAGVHKDKRSGRSGARNTLVDDLDEYLTDVAGPDLADGHSDDSATDKASGPENSVDAG